MLQNTWNFVQTVFLFDLFLKNTENRFGYISQRPYIGKKNPDDVGVTLTLQVTRDRTDYGIDKKTQRPRDDNRLNTFDVTVLNGEKTVDFKKGDLVSLADYLPEKSYVINYDLILRCGKVMRYNEPTKQTNNSATNK